MSKISMLRALVNNGWTIANRRILNNRVGGKAFNELVSFVKNPDPHKFYGEGYDYRKWEKFIGLKYDTVQNYCVSPRIVEDFGCWGRWKIKFLADDARPIEQALRETPEYFTPMEKYWGRKINVGKGNWNSEKYVEFKNLDQWMPNRKIATGEISQDSELVKARKALFKDLKPLGCEEIHYRGEVYPEFQEAHFKYLSNLKPGDIYAPKSNLWISNNSDYAFGNYGNATFPNWHNVHYEILCSKDAKIIQKPYSYYHGKLFTEGIYPDSAKFKIIDTKTEGNTLKLRMEYIAD